ncbi:PIG-L deacetylase family protein [Deinococcus cellulosilyticus]|uniref:GlcNAc-PI de-N-acetylase n=1 Tax=Deinococcus cellulosilyticus (strain DSM 18568 / NBRC 106333 / KACC 11606 / 5516J-15) TaxID=1223518 RepID=A0A511N035_DEIC1|nr:PIG-L deacetylase family protein [Deinococcus cellulosilyticus]GEM46179.1 GlcNAc-PI de-N-acetylase [Deinococcus cellulosilyticus NBRC 106333 = KACC 11606]
MNLLAVFAHPDDELWCVGTLKKHLDRGDRVMLVWTTLGEMASQYEGKTHEEVRQIRQQHGAYVAGEIGCEYRFFDMGDSRMTGSREEALQLARLYSEFRPDAVITWDDFSPHPDHRQTAKIAFDALTLTRIPKIINEGLTDTLEAHRKAIKFYQYYTQHATFPAVHVDVTQQMETKLKLFSFYRDFYKWEYSNEAFGAEFRRYGQESDVQYAEKFTVRRVHAPAHDFLR